MEIVFEIIGEFIMELFFETSKNKKISLWIRIPLIILLTLLYVFICGALLLIGVSTLKTNIYIGILFVAISILVFFGFLMLFLKEKRADKKL